MRCTQSPSLRFPLGANVLRSANPPLRLGAISYAIWALMPKALQELRTTATGAHVLHAGRRMKRAEAEAVARDIMANDPSVAYAEPDQILEKMATNPQSPPPGLDWDLFLGVAKPVAYHPAYHPFSWRGWTDFGVGAIGDMGAHLIDQPFWALGLGHPTTVSASGSPWGGPTDNPASYPLAMMAQKMIVGLTMNGWSRGPSWTVLSFPSPSELSATTTTSAGLPDGSVTTIHRCGMPPGMCANMYVRPA